MLKRLLGETVVLVVKHGRNLGSIRADPGQLEQVIINLAVNARDAMASKGGGTLTIQTYAGRVDFGVIADRKAVPQLQSLADALERAFHEACQVFAAPQEPPTSVQTRKRPVAKATRKPRAASKAAKAPAARPRKAATV